jgi:hypothetical protein
VERWTVERTVGGSHYQFGGISASGGVFVALEYSAKRGNAIEALVARSTADGAELYRAPLDAAEAQALLAMPSRLALHPAGMCLALPLGSEVLLRPLAPRVKVPAALPLTGPSYFGAAFHPDGRALATVDYGSTVTFHDTRTWAVARTLKTKLKGLRAVCFTPDGKRLAAAGDAGKIVVCDAGA